MHSQGEKTYSEVKGTVEIIIFFKIPPSIGTAKGIHGAKKQGSGCTRSVFYVWNHHILTPTSLLYIAVFYW